MVQYSPPPEDLSVLNPIQRYMQKGPHFDTTDWGYLLIFVLAYFTVRPYIQKLAKWWFSDKDMKEGEKALEEYARSKAKVGPNAIRGSEGQEAVSMLENSGETSTGSNIDKTGQVVNRKTKTKSEADQLLDWDDEPERKPTEGDKGDVVTWLDKWTNEE